MFCRNCGKELKDTDKFCVGCGTPVARSAAAPVVPPVQAQTVQAPSYPFACPAPAPAPAQKKKFPVLLVSIGSAALLVVLIVAVILISVLNSDSVVVAKAISKSAQAYSSAAADMDLPDLESLRKDQAASQALSVWVEDMEYAPELEGVGMQMTADYDLPNRFVGIELRPYYGSLDILNARLQIADSEVSLCVPELTGDTAYMVDTENLGPLLNNLGAQEAGLENFRFNLFDIMEQLNAATTLDKEAEKQLNDAVAAFGEAIIVEKTGKETIPVNDSQVKCKVYHVTVPQEATEALLNAIEDTYEGMDIYGVYMDIFADMGLPADVLRELASSLNQAELEYGSAFDEMRYALDTLGDLELDLYLNGGYVMAAVYEDTIEGTPIEITLNLGGGENYVDDISLRILVDYENEIVILSSGDHSGKNGPFTDKTTIDIIESGYAYRAVDMRFSYDPKASGENFSWSFENDYYSAEVYGLLTGGKNSMSLYLDEIDVYEGGQKLIGLGLEYSVGEFEADAIHEENIVCLTDMSASELESTAMAIMENAYFWVSEMEYALGDLIYYFS